MSLRDPGPLAASTGRQRGHAHWSLRDPAGPRAWDGLTLRRATSPVRTMRLLAVGGPGQVRDQSLPAASVIRRSNPNCGSYQPTRTDRGGAAGEARASEARVRKPRSGLASVGLPARLVLRRRPWKKVEERSGLTVYSNLRQGGPQVVGVQWNAGRPFRICCRLRYYPLSILRIRAFQHRNRQSASAQIDNR